MPRDVRVYLEDILQAAEKIQKFTKGFTKHRFCKDSKTVDLDKFFKDL